MSNRMMAAALVGLALLAGGVAHAGRSITLKGSDTLVILAQRWAENYMKGHPARSSRSRAAARVSESQL